jgi:hypothetical protein
MRTLELPDPLFDELVDAANASQTTPVDWIAARLRSSQAPRVLSAEEREQADHRLSAFFGIANSGDPDSANNERIDAPLYS